MAIIFLPGIKGSELVDSYPLDWPVRWSLEDMTVGDVFENPLDLMLGDGLHDRGDAHWMRPFRLIRFAYSPLLAKLRAWKAPEPVHVFTYDWRKPVELAAARLVQFIGEVEDRERMHGRAAPLSFVTHSMGGLVLRSALGLRNARDPFAGIGRVVFIAPPFRGAIGAAESLVKGERDGMFGTDEDYRRLARTFPSVYAMTPSYRDAAVDEAGKPLDLFDAANWQANVRDGGEFSARFLADAEALVRGRAAGHGGSSAAPLLSDAALAAAADRVMVMISAGVVTPRTLTVQTRNARNPNWFDFADVRTDTQGDGRVHFLSAAVRGVTFAAYTDTADHARVCRSARVANAVSLWLEGKKALRMTPRGPQHSVARSGRSYFDPWDGDPASLAAHVA